MTTRTTQIVARMWRRCDAAKLVGGIALFQVIDGQVEVPAGWVLDPCTCYFVPPDVDLDASVSVQ